ncbi:hypothetical protein C0989_006462 [Termitomyces sp. Mn162]|nr:hypothetical protein C0989_006462 [Termitomyces sp. Mn162]
MKSCLNPAATPREPHSSASPWLTSPLPSNNREQPTNPHQVTLVSTPGPPTSSLMKEPLTPDAILRNMTPTRTNYAARTNLASPNPANEEGPTAFATSAGIRARSREDLCSPPANRTTKKTKAPDPLGTMRDSKVRPPIPIWRMSPPQTKENPYAPGWKFRELNSITPPRNATELHRRTPTTPAKPREPSLRCPAPSQQTPGLASTDRH